MKPILSLSAMVIAASLVVTAAAPAQAGFFDRFKRGGESQDQGPTPPDAVNGAAAPVAQAGADDAMRMDRIEQQMRTLTGQVEELTFQLKQLQDQMKRIQQPSQRSEAPSSRQSVAAGAAPPPESPPPAQPDPIGRAIGSNDTGAPPPPGGPALGAPPRTLGQVDVDPNAPQGQPLDLSSVGSNGGAAADSPAALTGDSRTDYDAAYNLVLKGDYEVAETSFRQFLAAYPKDPLAADAQYWVGESLYARQDFRGSADAFLSGYKQYPKSTKAPDMLLKLGLSLNGLGQRDAACATYAEILKQYPKTRMRCFSASNPNRPVPAADELPPVSDQELDRLFRRFADLDHLGLAVSGGADSLALLVLAVRWRRRRGTGPALTVLTVDHGLRSQSADEARFVASVANAHSVPAVTLRWDGPHPASDIEAAARAARYGLLTRTARELGIAQIATAHHRDDQAETFLLRLARGSGVYGLSGMAPEVERDGIRVVRPLLELSHARLAAVVQHAGLAPAADPHNLDERFSRARIRALMPILAREGLDAEQIVATAGRLRRASEALDGIVDRLIARAASADDLGAVRLDGAAWAMEPEEIRLRALARILRALGGADYVPRLDSVEKLEVAMRDDGSPFRRTLAGVLVDRRKGEFRFQREAGRTGLASITVDNRFDGVWDCRFQLAIDIAGAPPVELGALGADGRRALAVCVPGGMPQAIEALPAIRRGPDILAVPGLGIMPGGESGMTVAARSLVTERMMHPSRLRDM